MPKYGETPFNFHIPHLASAHEQHTYQPAHLRRDTYQVPHSGTCLSYVLATWPQTAVRLLRPKSRWARFILRRGSFAWPCLLYTSDAADE